MFIRTNVRNYADAYRVIQAMDLQAPLNTSEVRENGGLHRPVPG